MLRLIALGKKTGAQWEVKDSLKATVVKLIERRPQVNEAGKLWTVDKHAYIKQPHLLGLTADWYTQRKRNARDVMAGDQNGWLITSCFIPLDSRSPSFSSFTKNSFPLTSMHSLSPKATVTSSPALVVCSFPKALSLPAACFFPHPAHHLVAHEPNVSQASCARKQTPRVGSHYHQRNRQERLFAHLDVVVLAEIWDRDVEKWQLSKARMK